MIITRWRGFAGALLGTSVWIAVTGAPLHAQQRATGTIAGTVVDADNKEVLPDVQVTAVSTGRIVRTGPDGRFRMLNVPVGPQSIRVNRLGYSSQARTVAVTDGTTTVDFALPRTSVTLQLQVVLGTSAPTEAARETGASIGILMPDSISKAPVTNFSELLNSRIAGLTVIDNSGVVGSGSRIRIRGVSSATLSNEPLIVMDGVR
ncbi:MAG TPA: carboxypeptidase regulatory-like domain-containing protein, partial [Gemmatimonadaceae bacterium]|nr:carboxypeptidase regulatory-like domain-containing protein [Gemmatimonadaceae bacterium]